MARPSTVIGKDAGIEHGTIKGYRQHLYRHVASCQPCRDANAAAQRGGKPARPKVSAKAWNGGMIGDGRTAAPAAREACTESLCGTEAAGTDLPQGWQGATVDGVRRRYCRAWCATYAEALADIRSLRTGGES